MEKLNEAEDSMDYSSSSQCCEYLMFALPFVVSKSTPMD